MSELSESLPQERLIIDNFCGIKHAELDIRPINLFIGPQAIGKSVAAKLIYLIKNIFLLLSNSPEDYDQEWDFRKDFIEHFNRYFPVGSRGNIDFSINYYLSKDEFIQIMGTRKNNKLVLQIPKFLEDIYANIKSNIISKKTSTTNEMEIIKSTIILRIILIEKISRYYNSVTIPSRQIFIPAVRSFFSQLEEHLFSLLGGIEGMDPIIQKFGPLYRFAKTIYVSQEESDNILPLFVSEILHGKYQNTQLGEFIEHPDGRIARLVNTSSGQQEILPLVIILSVIKKLAGENRPCSIYIEEPEAHVFPSTQAKVVDFISYVFNKMERKTQFIITTHSPYILTELNNLIYAHYLYKSLDPTKQVKLESIVPKNQAISLDDVSVYYFSEDGVKSTIDKENHLINADPIDDISDESATRFNSMLDLEFDK